MEKKKLKTEDMAKLWSVSPSTVTHMTPGELKERGYEKRKIGKEVEYIKLGKAAKPQENKVEQYEEARRRKAIADANLAEYKDVVTRHVLMEMGAQAVWDSLKQGFAEYVKATKELDVDGKLKLAETYDKCWTKTELILRGKLAVVSLD